MNLLLILLSIVVFALISHFFKQYYKFFVLISILLVIFCYFFIFIANERNGFDVYYRNSYASVCYNDLDLSLNGMLNVFKEHRLYYVDIRDCPEYKIHKSDIEFNNTANLIKRFINVDFSLYNYKIYSYFGITPILLFYLPFNFVTDLYLYDGTVCFLLLVLIFLLSFFLLKKLLIELNVKNELYSIEILSIFLIGIGNYFLSNGCEIYNVEIETSVFLVLSAISIFYLYLKEKNIIKQQFFVFLISTSLALSVGARPHNVFLILFFLLGIIYGNCYRDKNHILKIIIIFLVPCILYGSLLAVYNYLRFDSIFDFGFNYQICHLCGEKQFFNISDFFISVKQSFLCFPEINSNTVFFLHYVEHSDSLHDGLICGIIYSCPVILFLFITPYIYKIFKNKTNFILFLNICFITIVVEFVCTNVAGTWTRYVDEYLMIILVLSLSFFIFLYNISKKEIIKIILIIGFIIIFIYSMFINISFIFGNQYDIMNEFKDKYNVASFLYSVS